ncbi:universal stress protein [Pseudomonas rubra]|uniref:Universal stress protein n=1 Tax=Pseudomonas rubra TaxID=2942627 RepID=A0ABT5PBF8_9PSED|nr:universal stress protein [Pseudomonas rubra]MDD1015645.1 universal stress protein [Pseudomonas rubra]MDD1040267.1 universal stress protein [Pseudomonas rubra]MDD1153858.1 universal stress protein [Pseudomonas rubra]
MIRSMLYATDLGVYAPFVLQHALALARTFNAELYVIHAVEPMGQFAESLLQSYLDEQTLDELHSEGVTTVMANIEQRVLENFRDELGEEADLALIKAVRVRQGDPAQVILEQAQRLSVDLLIFGSHSQGAGVDIPIGRTAVRLLQLSPVPVYMVPLAQHLGRRKS